MRGNCSSKANAAELQSRAPVTGLLDVTPEQLALLQALPAEKGMGLLAERAFAQPELRSVEGVGLVDVTDPRRPQVVLPTPEDVSAADLVQVVGPDGRPRYVRAEEAVGQPAFSAPKAPTIETFYDETTGQPYKARWNPQTGQYERVGGVKAPTGMSVEVGPDGEFRLVQGPGAGMGKQAKNTIEDKQIDTTEMLARISSIKEAFRPEYQQFGTRLGMSWASLKDKFGSLNPEDKAQLREYTTFRRRSFENLNRTLNELSGAAITPQEAERLKKMMPDPGEGVFDGDSPTEFKAKMDDVVRQTTLALARYRYAKAHGLDQYGIALSEVPDLIDKRGMEIEQRLRAQNPNAPEEVITFEVRERLSREFGI